MQSKLLRHLYLRFASVSLFTLSASTFEGRRSCYAKIWKRRKIRCAVSENTALGPQVVLVMRKLQFVVFSLTCIKAMKAVAEQICDSVEVQSGRRLAEDQESLQIPCFLMDGAMEIFVKLHMR